MRRHHVILIGFNLQPFPNELGQECCEAIQREAWEDVDISTEKHVLELVSLSVARVEYQRICLNDKSLNNSLVFIPELI